MNDLSDNYWFNERYEAMYYAEHGHFDWQEDPVCEICDPRPEGCCGVCPPIVGGGYDCTCQDNPNCSVG